MSLTIAILAGGESRRMGRDKAQIAIGRETLLERTARVAREVCPSVMVVGRARPDGWPLPDVLFLRDDAPGQGPLGGLETALEHAAGRTVLLVACDLPRLTSDALTWLLREGAARASSGDGLVAVNEGRREPLFALYAPGCLALARRQRASGRRSLLALLDAGAFALIDAPPEVCACLRDADTPEDLAGIT